MERPKRITNVSHINRCTIEKSKYIRVYSGRDYPPEILLVCFSALPSLLHPSLLYLFTTRVGVSPMELDLYMGERIW